MAIIITSGGRPAIDVIQDNYTPPVGEWGERLASTAARDLLRSVLAAVGRLDFVGEPRTTFGGTAFVVGPDLLLSAAIGPVVERCSGGYVFRPGMSALVNFRHEVIPAEPVVVKVEEVVYSDPRCGVELIRAKLPAQVKPLRLSVRDPDELAGRPVGLIGYPARDSRGDPQFNDELFRSTYGVKRLLPGWVTGHQAYGEHGLATLLHDCSTSGGCGGAPLVDLETGEVLGVHFAGEYLRTNYAVSAWELARDPRYAAAGVVFAGPLPPPAVPVTVDGGDAGAADAELEGSVWAPTLDDPVDDDPVDDDAGPSATDALQAFERSRIIIAGRRPAFLVDRGRPVVNGVWEPILRPHVPRLETAVRAVGKLRDENGPHPFIGTAFLVGKNLAMTASYSALQFAAGVGDAVRLNADVRPSIDFGEALGLPPEQATAWVTRVCFIHPYFSVALLQLDRVPTGVAELDLVAQIPAGLAGRALVVLSFAAEDGRRPREVLRRVYEDRWGRLFLQPGKAWQLGQTPGLPSPPALVHDCTITGGSGGAPVIDIDTGYVLGIHTHGKWLEGGYAQPSWELARDPYVWRHPIRFRPDPRPSWLGDWNDPRPVSQPPVPTPEPRRQGWTVDDELDFGLEEPKDLQRILAQHFQDKEIAFTLAENAGVPCYLVNFDQDSSRRWRAILRVAATAGKLRRLLQMIADDENYAGIAHELRKYL